MNWEDHPLEYVDRLSGRAVATISLVVVHCTELPDIETAREYGQRIHHERTHTGNSGHFYIDRDGTRQCWVPLDKIAHHTRGFNETSIGIELVNLGRFPNWLDSTCQVMTQPYPADQLSSLITLLDHLQNRMPHLTHIAGHEDLDQSWVASSDDPGVKIRRKMDPGILFPWLQVMSNCALERLFQKQSI